jgi:site-specific DNA recombinase
VAHPIDDTPEGQTLRQVLGAFAELEREKIKERSVRGMKERLKSGLPRGTAAPYGYQWTKTPHASTLEINEEEATVVRQIFRWILEGRTLRSIGVQLSREKVLTRRLGQKKTSPWNWSNTSLHRMAHYEGYLGHMYHGKVKGAGKTLEKLPEEDWLEIKIPAIIDQETFDAAAQQLIKNGQTASRRRKRDYLFSASTLRCGQCGNGMNGEAKINRYKPERLIDHIYYRCNTHGRILDGGHCRSTVAAWRLEPLVWSYVERLLSDPAVILESIVIAQYGSLHQRAEVERRLAALDTELAQFDQRDARLIVAYENDIITAEELKERRADHASQKQRLANEHWDLEQALVTLGAPPPEREALKDYLSHVKAQLKTLSNAEKRRVLDTLHIVVTWTADQPLQVSGSVPSADPGERCPFSDQLVDDLYLTIYE